MGSTSIKADSYRIFSLKGTMVSSRRKRMINTYTDKGTYIVSVYTSSLQLFPYLNIQFLFTNHIISITLRWVQTEYTNT